VPCEVLVFEVIVNPMSLATRADLEIDVRIPPSLRIHAEEPLFWFQMLAVGRRR
jgi:hypothetical protein